MKNNLHIYSTRLLGAGLTWLLATSLGEAASPIEEARAALARKDFAAAETLLLPLATAENPDAAVCHELGTLRLRQGRFEDAISLFEKATKLDATKSPYFASLGMAVAQRMNQVPMMQQAVLSMKLKKSFARAVELDPNNVTGLIGLARFYTQAPEIVGGSVAKAKEFAERVRQLVPYLGELELGAIAEHGEDHAAAANHYEAAVHAAPTNPAPHLSAARVLTKLGRKAEARLHLEAALKIDPANPRTQQALAEL